MLSLFRTTNKAKNLNIAYIGGGSRGWAWGFMMDLAMDEQLCGTVRLYDIDKDAAKRNEIIGTKISAHPEAKSQWKYEVSDSLQEALTGADFVVISILPGTFDEMASDVHLPERVGVYQPVGDTVGPAGGLVSNVNVPNRGQIPNLPIGAVVETNALFGLDRIEPVYAGPVPSNILPLIARHVYNQENTLRAALTCDRKLGLSTFMNDPQMGAVSLEDGEKLFNDMLENQRKYLPAKWFE